MNIPPTQQNDFSLKDLISDLWINRKIIIISLCSCVSIAIAYLLITPNTYRASLTLLPYTQAETRDARSNSSKVDVSFVSIQSFEKNFLSKGLMIEHSNKFFKSKIDSKNEYTIINNVKLSSDLNVTQKVGPITVSFSYSDPQVALRWLNSYIKFTENYTRLEVKNSLEANLQNEIEQYRNTLNSKNQIALEMRNDKISELEEALIIAKKAGITHPQMGSLTSLENNEFLKGSKILYAEIETLKQAKNITSFSLEYYEIKERILNLQDASKSFASFNFFTSSQENSTTSYPIYPKKPVIILFSIFIGLILGIFISLLKTFLRSEN